MSSRRIVRGRENAYDNGTRSSTPPPHPFRFVSLYLDFAWPESCGSISFPCHHGEFSRISTEPVSTARLSAYRPTTSRRRTRAIDSGASTRCTFNNSTAAARRHPAERSRATPRDTQRHFLEILLDRLIISRSRAKYTSRVIVYKSPRANNISRVLTDSSPLLLSRRAVSFTSPPFSRFLLDHPLIAPSPSDSEPPYLRVVDIASPRVFSDNVYSRRLPRSRCTAPRRLRARR